MGVWTSALSDLGYLWPK